ncbi:hypothetical protein [Allosalinactinospora lopnorensis]|uniref:hypothetical protein n=1 Tax=Allosalinactinospora lopnorensis TaxID=1352348 RepID=UPI000623F9BE|nr:hypothetical protein [Allosalinactinospora lopnorensis]
MTSTRERCALTDCEWCERDDLCCRFCSGSGWWRPEKPRRDSSGVIHWVRVDEPCRMCAGTGKEHNPLMRASGNGAAGG